MQKTFLYITSTDHHKAAALGSALFLMIIIQSYKEFFGLSENSSKSLAGAGALDALELYFELEIKKGVMSWAPCFWRFPWPCTQSKGRSNNYVHMPDRI